MTSKATGRTTSVQNSTTSMDVSRVLDHVLLKKWPVSKKKDFNRLFCISKTHPYFSFHDSNVRISQKYFFFFNKAISQTMSQNIRNLKSLHLFCFGFLLNREPFSKGPPARSPRPCLGTRNRPTQCPPRWPTSPGRASN